MQFLKYLLMFLFAFVAALFTYGNWRSVELNLWSGLLADVNLPFLLLVTYLVGLLPMWLYHRTARWRMNQRLQTTERTVEALRVSIPDPAPVDPTPTP